MVYRDGENRIMPPGIYKRKSPVQEKLAIMKDVILEDALSRKKSVKELAKIYNVSYGSLLIYYKKNRIKKKKIKLEYKSGYTRGSYNNQKRQIEDLRNYIKKNGITKEEVISTILSF